MGLENVAASALWTLFAAYAASTILVWCIPNNFEHYTCSDLTSVKGGQCTDVKEQSNSNSQALGGKDIYTRDRIRHKIAL